MRAVWQIVVSAWMLGTSSAVFAIDPMIADLKARLAKADADVVNAYLDDHFETKVTRLRHLILRCDPDALSLTVSLLNSSNATATQGNSAMLELAMGKCPEKLLPIVPLARVRTLCAVDAFAETKPGLVPPAALLKEIDRRVGYLRMRGLLATSENGRACLDAYSASRLALRY